MSVVLSLPLQSTPGPALPSLSMHAANPPRPLRPLAQAGAHSRQGDIPDLDILVAPLVEQLGRADLLGDILGQHRVALGRLNLDLAVGHFREFLLCKSLSRYTKDKTEGCWVSSLLVSLRLGNPTVLMVRASRTLVRVWERWIVSWRTKEFGRERRCCVGGLRNQILLSLQNLTSRDSHALLHALMGYQGTFIMYPVSRVI